MSSSRLFHRISLEGVLSYGNERQVKGTGDIWTDKVVSPAMPSKQLWPMDVRLWPYKLRNASEETFMKAASPMEHSRLLPVNRLHVTFVQGAASASAGRILPQ